MTPARRARTTMTPSQGSNGSQGGHTRLTEDALPPALAFIAFATVALCMPPHNDTWWHLRSGLEMVRQGGILLTERLSHTAQGAPLYHNHEWLTQLLFYSLFTIGGPILLAVACAASVMAGVATAWRLVVGSPEARFGFLVALLVGTTMAWAIRPQAISLLMFVASLHLATSNRDRWLPLICVVWANLHAVAITGVVVAGCSALDAIVKDRSRVTRSVTVLVGCALAPMLTPLGWHYWPRVVQVVRMARQLGIHEYRPPLEVGMLPFWIGAAGFLLVLGKAPSTAFESRKTRVLVLVALTFGVAAVLSVRNIPFFVLSAVPAMSRLLPESRTAVRRKPLPAAALAVAASVLAVAIAGVMYAWREGGYRLGWRPITPAAVAAIRSCDGRLFNGFADGGALTWFVPERKVFVDSRGVEAYPSELLVRSREADLQGRYRELFEDFNIDCAVVSAESVMAAALAADSRMCATYRDSQWQIYRRLPKGQRGCAALAVQ